MKDIFRYCLKCKKEKLANEFYIDKFSQSGWYHRCKLCTDYYYKKCTKCKRIKSKQDFYKNSASKDKLDCWCKTCKGRPTKDTSTYFSRHKKELMDYNYKWTKKQRKINPFFKALTNLRYRLHGSLKAKKWHKDGSFTKNIGCDRDFLGKWLESKFKPGMTWDNYGKTKDSWSIDHIKPLSSATTQEDMLKLCHYSNLQPLWVIENSKKSNR